MTMEVAELLGTAQLTGHVTELRRFRIDGNGAHVGPRFQDLRGVLTGIPQPAREGRAGGTEFGARLPVGAPVEPAGPDDRRPVAIEARQILLVEDDDNVREALRRILTLDGHRVEVARDGPEGVELALATAPEVVFIDIGLPGIDGYEVGRRIRAGLGSRALLVALTAHDLEEDRRRSTEAGFDAHLVQPASYEDLTRTLARGRPGD